MKNLVSNPQSEIAKIHSKASEIVPHRSAKTVTITDLVTGEILRDSTSYQRFTNGSGFVISYTEKMCEFLVKVTSPTVIRLFMIIAHRQGYGVNGIYGYRCSKKYLRELLHVDRKTIYEALDYLKSNFLVVENRFDGQLEFMVNPDYITIGQDKKARQREWSRRWDYYFKHKDDLKR